MRNPWVRIAFEKGYRVTSNGHVIGRRGKLIRLCRRKHDARLRFGIVCDDKQKSILVHQLQAYQKYGDGCYTRNIEVRHLDGDITNNSVDNIVLGTRQQNCFDIPSEQRLKSARHAALSRRKFTPKQIKLIRQKNATGVSYRLLAIEYVTCRSTISYIISRKTYADVF